jgi:hypothetical protein
MGGGDCFLKTQDFAKRLTVMYKVWRLPGAGRWNGKV